MTVKVERQTVYLGAGLTRIGWVVWDGNEMVGYESEYRPAHRRAHDVKEQKEHRDGI